MFHTRVVVNGPKRYSPVGCNWEKWACYGIGPPLLPYLPISKFGNVYSICSLDIKLKCGGAPSYTQTKGYVKWLRECHLGDMYIPMPG